MKILSIAQGCVALASLFICVFKIIYISSCCLLISFEILFHKIIGFCFHFKNTYQRCVQKDSLFARLFATLDHRLLNKSFVECFLSEIE